MLCGIIKMFFMLILLRGNYCRQYFNYILNLLPLRFCGVVLLLD